MASTGLALYFAWKTPEWGVGQRIAVTRMRDKKSRTRRRRKRSTGNTAIFGWVVLFIILLNVGALLVFEPVRDPLDVESYIQDDALVHFLMFFFCAVIGGPLLLRWFSLGIVAIGLLGFGMAAEILQAFSTERTADFVDFVADEAGILAALILIAVVRQVFRLVTPGHAHDGGGRREREELYLEERD